MPAAAQQQQTEAAVAGAVTKVVPWYAQLAAVAIGVGVPLLLAWLGARLDTPRTATTAEADPDVQRAADDAVAAYDASGR